VGSLRALDRYPWCGQATLMGHRPVPWQHRQAVLARFGHTLSLAVRAYREYVAAGILLGRRPDLVGGGLVRSLGGWAAVRAMRPRPPEQTADPRILGSGEFAGRLLREAEARERPRLRRAEQARRAVAIIETACTRAGISPAEFATGSRRGTISVLRAEVATTLVTEVGLSLAEVARRCGVTTSAISRAVRRPRGA
jgi:hypothetical protein